MYVYKMYWLVHIYFISSAPLANQNDVLKCQKKIYIKSNSRGALHLSSKNMGIIFPCACLPDVHPSLVRVLSALNFLT